MNSEKTCFAVLKTENCFENKQPNRLRLSEKTKEILSTHALLSLLIRRQDKVDSYEPTMDVTV